MYACICLCLHGICLSMHGNDLSHAVVSALTIIAACTPPSLLQLPSMSHMAWAQSHRVSGMNHTSCWDPRCRGSQ